MSQRIASRLLIAGVLSSSLLVAAQPAQAVICLQTITGGGCPSGSSGDVTIAAPYAPIIGVATSGVAGGTITATANWSPPPPNSDPVYRAMPNGYRVLAKRLEPIFDTSTQSTRWVVVGTTTSDVLPTSPMTLITSVRTLSMTLPGPGTYSFQVQATSGAGNSLYSAASNLVTGQ